MKGHDSTCRIWRRNTSRLKLSVAVAGLCAVAGCGGGGGGLVPGGAVATSPGSGANPAAAASVPAGASAAVVQCDTTDAGSQLAKVAGQVVLPAGITVPAGDAVYGTSAKLASGALFMIGHRGATSVGCYQPTSVPDSGTEISVEPDNRGYAEGAIVVAAGLSAHPFGAQCRQESAAPGLDINDCADIQDGNSPVTIATGTPEISALAYVVPDPPELGQYLQNTLPADTSKPVVEMIVDNQTTGAARAKGFSGAVACSMDAPADCAATLPYFLAQTAAGSPMTAADYSRAFAQIDAVVAGRAVAGTASAAPVGTGTTPAGIPAAAGAGADPVIADYAVAVPAGYTIPIGAGGAPAPVRGGSGLSFSGEFTFATGTASEELVDMGGSPTYAACSSGVVDAVSQKTVVGAAAGDGFCYFASAGSSAGVFASVTVVSYSNAGTTANLQVTVWK